MVAWWSFDTCLALFWDGIAAANALWPGGEALARRLVIAFALGGAIILGSRQLSDAVRRDVAALGDCDLQYKRIIESTFESIITIDENAEVVAVNAATSRTFGGAASDFLKLKIDDLIVRVIDDVDPDQPGFGRLIAATETWTHGALQVVAQGLNGRQFLAEVTVLPSAYGDKSNRIVLLQEVTERILAKQAARESEEKYRDLFEQMLEGVFRSLGDGTILAANPAMLRMLGYSSEDELCRSANARDLFSSRDQHEALLNNLGRDGSARGIVIEVLCKDGSKRLLLANMKAIPGHIDDSIVYQGTFSDISELQRTTYALKDNEKHFRALAENSPDIVSVITENAEVVYCSPSILGITGFKPELRTGRIAFENVHADDIEVCRRAVRQMFDRLGTPKWFNFRYLHRDGSILYMEAVGTAFLNSRGELRGVINTRDISQRHRTNQQLHQAQKMQAVGQLTGGIAHDFNNLLTVIVGNLQLIEEAARDTHIKGLAETAFKAAMHGADLTYRLLAFAKRQPLEPKVIDVAGLLVDIEPLLRRSLGASMKINIEGDRDLWLASVDPAQLESAVLNLAINARDAMGSDGLLTISTCNFDATVEGLAADPTLPLGEHVRVRVSDTGSGMTEEIRKTAIEPFFSTKSGTDGSGLGLSMVYGFVEQSGGHMRLNSQAGHGTCVTLYLPRAAATDVRDGKTADATTNPRGNETVLVVDDNNDVRKSVAALVSTLGYDVLEACDGSSALQQMNATHVDLLFSDVKMPGMSGFELATTTRQRYPHIRTMLTSGFTEEPTAPCGEDEVADFAFLPKPYSKNDLATKLRVILDN